MKNIKNIRFIVFTLLFAWMAVIFIMSAQPAEQSSQLSGGIVSKLIAAFFGKFQGLSSQQQAEFTYMLTFVVRKTAHFLEYFILGLLAKFAIRTLSNVKYKPLFTFAFCVLYAISDELHQYFVPGRACRILDVCIDSLGSAVAIILVFIICKKDVKDQVTKVRKKKLIEQNLTLFENLQKTQLELNELKRILNKNADEISSLKPQLEKANEPKAETTVTEPLRRLEEKVITNATLKPDVEYGAKVIGSIVVAAAEYSNKLTVGGDDSKKELVNLILGKTEIAKAEILSVIQTDDSFDVKCTKMDQIAAVAKEYLKVY